MSVIVELTIPTEQFDFGREVDTEGYLEIELEQMVPTGSSALPNVWASGSPDAISDLTEAFRTSEKISSFEVMDTFQMDESDLEQQLFRTEWVLEELDVLGEVIEIGGTLLAGSSETNAWYLRLRFPGHDEVTRFYEFLNTNDVTGFTIQRVAELEGRPNRRPLLNLTPEQREALFLAARRGYFGTPQEITLTELADELGITQQAVSNRIRQATERIIDSVLTVSDPPARE